MNEPKDIYAKISDPKPDTTLEQSEDAIIIREVGGNPTRVSDTECDTPEKLLSWVLYFSPRKWVTVQFLEEFIKAEISRQGMNVEEPLL